MTDPFHDDEDLEPGDEVGDDPEDPQPGDVLADDEESDEDDPQPIDIGFDAPDIRTAKIPDDAY